MNLRASFLMALGLFGCATAPLNGDTMQRVAIPGRPELFMIPAKGYAVAPGAIMQIQGLDQHTGAWTLIGSTAASTTAEQYKQKLYAWSTTVSIQREPFIIKSSATARIRVVECDASGASCQPINMYDQAGIDCVYHRGWEGRSDPANLDVYDIGQSCSNGRAEVELHYGGIAGGSSQ